MIEKVAVRMEMFRRCEKGRVSQPSNFEFRISNEEFRIQNHALATRCDSSFFIRNSKFEIHLFHCDTNPLLKRYPSPVSNAIVVGCVTEDTPKYLGQTLRLLQSIRWFGGALAQAHVVVGAVERIDARARRALEAYGADIRIVPRFEPRNGSANRLQLFAELRKRKEQHFLMLDCDTIVVRDPSPLLKRNVFHAKIAPFPTVTHEVFERLFAHFGL